MDEVCGAEDFCKLIFFRATAGDTSYLLLNTGDYIVWYAKNKDMVKRKKSLSAKPSG